MNIKNTILKKTKIIATIGPSSETEATLRQLFKAGVTTVRCNTSHGDFEEHGNRIKLTKKLRKELDLPITILLDTKGPEIRVHTMDNKKMAVKRGDILTIFCKKEILGKNGQFSVTYTDLAATVKKGSSIMLDDGKLSLEVISSDVKKGEVKARALNPHFVGTKKAVNVPGATLTLPFIGQHDKDFLKWGIKQDIDVVAASFVSSAKDVIELRNFLDKNGGKSVKIMSKIEALKALTNLNEIIMASDSIMIARGDLGVEIPYQQVPFYEKLIISKCKAWGKPVVVATQMLDSMGDNPRPTRAEVTDVYYAAISGTDSTMLSGESANGNFPVAAVETMSTINLEAEANFNYLESFEQAYAFVNSANAESAYKIAHEALQKNVAAIIAFSEKGRLVNALSRFRPKSIIFGLIADSKAVTNYGYVYGVFAQEHKQQNDYAKDAAVKAICKKAGISGTVIVANKNEYRFLKV